jgi:hypothetical protein
MARLLKSPCVPKTSAILLMTENFVNSAAMPARSTKQIFFLTLRVGKNQFL